MNRPALSKAWALLLAFCILVLGGADTLLLELASGYLSTGYNGVVLDSPALVARFLLSSAVTDTFFICGLWALLVPVLRRVRLSPLQIFSVTAIVTVGLSLGIDAIRYKVVTMVGHLLNLHVILEMAGGDVSSVSSEAMPDMLPVAVILTAAAIGLLAVLPLARMAEERPGHSPALFSTPRPGAMLSMALVCGIASIFLLSPRSDAAERVASGLRRKPSAIVLSSFVRFSSDFDRDGYGLLSRPADPNPFDASVHAHAIDVPGNAIDENGLAGDHPTGFAPPPLVHAREPEPGPGLEPSPSQNGPRRPDFLLVYLESFRDDLLDRQWKEREITPFLNQLAREGTRSQRSFVHSPYTIRSRAQLFGGRLAPYAGQDTLIDDFKTAGYTVAYFSGQDDSFGRSEELIGTARADHFYDARQDLERRTSRSTHPSSLQVSWKLLNERVFAYLDAYDSDKPLFLYVNIVDTHFPYHSDELDDVLGVRPLRRSELGIGRRERVWETYANAAANVDRGVEDLVAAFRALRARGRMQDRDQAVLVTGDHGQAIYENGFLGHGRALDVAQTRVPLILHGIGGRWPEPLGAADLRGLLGQHLFEAPKEGEPEPPRARMAAEPDRQIVQYLPNLETPLLFALRGLNETSVYDFENGRLTTLDAQETLLERSGDPETSDHRDRFARLIRTWEALRHRDVTRVEREASGG